MKRAFCDIGDVEQLWWSNELGWTPDEDSATLFSVEESLSLNPPMGFCVVIVNKEE